MKFYPVNLGPEIEKTEYGNQWHVIDSFEWIYVGFYASRFISFILNF